MVAAHCTVKKTEREREREMSVACGTVITDI